MRYLLVLQFPGDSLADLDRVVALENELAKALDGLAEVDGHDVGSGEANIFVLTSDPARAFSEAQPVMESLGVLDKLTAAFRDVSGESYSVIWPVNYSQEFSIA